jgi:ketosteroid isomerase-like protein
MINVPIDDRIAIQDLMIAYCYAVDRLEQVEELLSVFTEDAVLDFSAIGLPLMHGHGEIRDFFDRVFADMSHHAHYITNFRLDSYDGESASMRAYVIGLGRSNDGNTVDVKVRYTFDVVRTGAGWRARRYIIEPMMPMPQSLNEIHGDH